MKLTLPISYRAQANPYLPLKARTGWALFGALNLFDQIGRPGDQRLGCLLITV